MKESLIVPLFFLFFALAVSVLSFRELHLIDPDASSHWSLAFATPADPHDASFSIANFGESRTFDAEVRFDDEVVRRDSFSVAAGDGQMIVISNPNKRSVTINVWVHGADPTSDQSLLRKEITKKFP